MTLRVTPQIQIGALLRSTAQHANQVAKLQQQIASGVRINRPSDDPLGTKVVLSRQTLLGRYEAERRTLGVARDRLNQSNSELLHVEDLFVQAKDVASQARTALNDSEKEFFARDIEAIFDQLTNAANSQFDGDYLFSGDAVRTQPYPPGSPLAAYAGSTYRQTLATSSHADLGVLYTGNEVFQNVQRRATVYIGSTGAKAGAGTDSSVGNGQLIVRHTATSFAAGSGVAAGASSVSGDTIIGPAGARTLTINDTSGTGASGTISLNGGSPVAFTNSDTDLRLTGPDGEVVYVNTTAITAGFNGTVDITADGTLSRDGGLTEVPIDFSTAQAVTDASGGVTFVDSTEIRGAGTEELEFPGTGDAFRVLAALRDELRNTRNLTPTEWQEALTRRMDELDRIHEHILSVVGDQAQTLKTIDDLDARLDNLVLDAKTRISDVASTDVPAAAVELQEAQNLLQYSYAVTSQVFGTSLLDYLA